jgi:hypothetical protein
MSQVRVTPSGVLDKDTEVSYIGKGNYIDALNIRHRAVDSNGGDFGGIVPVKGNANLVNTINGVAGTAFTYAAETQTYRVFVDVEDIYNGSISSHDATIYIEDSTGVLHTKTTGPFVNYSSTNLASAITVIKADLDNILNAWLGGLFTYSATTITKTISGTNVAGYFDVTTALTNEFFFLITNSQGEYAKFSQISEYHTEAGKFTFIGSAQLDDEMFVLLTGDDLNPDGTSVISEIGVIYPNATGYSYTKLLRSKKLKFHPQRKAEMQIERVGSQINIYWTDNLNPVRFVELRYANRKTINGLLVTTGGKYELFNINLETKLILENTSAFIEDIQIIHGGGSITAGNKRYTGRFVTDDFTYGDFLYPTNPINIYDSNPDTPFKITGSNPTVQTTKSVEMVLKNIPKGIYAYFDLVAIEYKGTTFEPVLVQRFKISETATELKIQHTNRGQTNEILSPNEILAITSKYISAKNIRLFDNRMVLSNLKEKVDLNLETWASSFTHTLETAQIDSVGVITNGSLNSQKLDYQLGEYLDPLNTLAFTSYMLNDTYRFGVQVQWKDTGKWSSPYWVDDIRFDTLSTNVNTSDNRRTANNINTNITDSSGENVNVYYVKFGNINLEYLIDGIRLKNLISAIRFVRSERIEEVIASGYFLPGSAIATAGQPVNPFHPTATLSFPFTRKTFPNGPEIETADFSDFLFFYSPDLFYSNKEYKFNQNTDYIKILGVPNLYDIFGSEAPIVTGTDKSFYTEFGGYFYTNKQSYFNIGYSTSPLNITEHQTLEPKELSKTSFSLRKARNGGPKSSNRKTEFFKLSNKLFNQGYFTYAGANTENIGVYYGQIFRDKGAHLKYPKIKNETVYQSTGHLRLITDVDNGTIIENVFGGDVFNQKTHYLLRMPDFKSPNYGGGGGFSIYSQNTINTQMFERLEHDDTKTGSGYCFPQYLNTEEAGEYFSLISTAITAFDSGTIIAGLAHYLQQWPEVSNQNEYSESYTFVDNTIVENGFDKDFSYDGSKLVSIAWSSAKLSGSLKNNYRYFQPLSVADLDLTHGEISHHEVINNAFYTFQERSVQRQYFRDASLVGAQEGTDIVVGSGSILGAPGVELTSIGTSKKESVIKGKNPNGKDIVYWYNDRLQKLVRLAGDGVSVLSDRGLATFFLNNGKYVSNEFYPLSGRGVHGVWNDKYGEAIFTFKYNDGVSNKSFTIAYDEIKNGFISFHSYAPNIYLPYNNTFFSQDPETGFENTIYLHDSGLNYTFYGVTGDYEPYIEFVMNYDPNLPKIFEAIQVNSERIPFASANKPVYFNTKNHTSYLDNADLEVREDLFYSTIKNDSTGTGLNSGDTSRLFGRWLKMKMFLASSAGTQKLINAIVKFRVSPRLYNQ